MEMEVVRLVPTMWAEFPHIADVEPLGERDQTVLEEIRAVLEKHDALNRFGINLIHRHFGLAEGEVALEFTDQENRRQVVEVRPEAEVVGAANVIATQWVFGTKGEGVECKGYCDYQDYGHKHRHAS